MPCHCFPVWLQLPQRNKTCPATGLWSRKRHFHNYQQNALKLDMSILYFNILPALQISGLRRLIWSLVDTANFAKKWGVGCSVIFAYSWGLGKLVFITIIVTACVSKLFEIFLMPTTGFAPADFDKLAASDYETWITYGGGLLYTYFEPSKMGSSMHSVFKHIWPWWMSALQQSCKRNSPALHLTKLPITSSTHSSRSKMESCHELFLSTLANSTLMVPLRRRGIQYWKKDERSLGKEF